MKPIPVNENYPKFKQMLCLFNGMLCPTPATCQEKTASYTNLGNKVTTHFIC